MCEEHLLLYHKDDIKKILEDSDDTKLFSVHISFVQIYENNPALGDLILTEPEKALTEWDKALLSAQTAIADEIKNENSVKRNVSCRIYNLPTSAELVSFPDNNDANKFSKVSGTVVRITIPKLLEFQREYICAKCKFQILVKADYDKKNLIEPPKSCINPEGCKSTNLVNFGDLNSENCKDYQEIKIQEQASKLGIGCIPQSIWVTLEDDLVDACKPGDNIIICGIVKRRWNTLVVGQKCEIELVIKANSLEVNNTHGASAVTPEVTKFFEDFWKTYIDEPLIGRDIILKSFCPQLFGLYFVKLATALVLAGGSVVKDDSSTGVRIRSESHLLLVGDPGTGKSHLLRFASKVISRSVLTTGIGSTAAGLTVSAIREDGEWQLEGGALVMADGGICCIDEFNSMKEHDRTSIHEAMEQQTISVAKASIVCKLSTKCSILAACNPKGNLDPNQPLTLNVNLASPLLSRFDLILLLRDTVNEEWDTLVADYILDGGSGCSKLIENQIWSVVQLQSYFKIVRKINPILTEESNQILGNYYQLQRRLNDKNKSRTTVRLLDSLIRLSQGHAKIMYHDKVEIIDAVFAIILVDTAMDNDSRLLNLNLNTHSTFCENPMMDYINMAKIVLEKMHLPELLSKEMEKWNTALTTKSRFFNRIDINHNGVCDISINLENEFLITSTQVESINKLQNNENEPRLEKKINENIEGEIINTDANITSKGKFGKNTIKKKCQTSKSTELTKPNNSRQVSKEETSNEFTNKEANKNTRKRGPTDNTKKDKKFKFQKKHIQNDIQLLNFMPSVNDDILNLNLDFDDDYNIEVGPNPSEEINHKQNEDIDKNISKQTENNIESSEVLNDVGKKVSVPKQTRPSLKEMFKFVPISKNKDKPNNCNIEKENVILKPSTNQNSQSSIFSGKDNIDDLDLDL